MTPSPTARWALPLTNTLGMKFGSEAVSGAGYNANSLSQGYAAKEFL